MKCQIIPEQQILQEDQVSNSLSSVKGSFTQLLDPIKETEYDHYIMTLKDNLLNAILGNEIDVGPVMNYLDRVQNINPIDKMISGT